MPHHFRTIEAFVQLLEQERAECIKQGKASQCFLEFSLMAGVYERVLNIVRTSNIGIVYPPPEECSIRDASCSATCQSSGRCHIMHTKAALPRESNGTRCPDCGLPCDPATGEHVCSDGQVRGFRVSA